MQQQQNPDEEQWKIVENKKRGRNQLSPDTQQQKKFRKQSSSHQKLITDYKKILNPTNKFQLLDSVDSNEDKSTELHNNLKAKSKIKPPPLFLASIQDMNGLITLLNSNEKIEKKYTLRVINKNNEVKLLTEDEDAYRNAVQELAKNDVKYFTYQLKSERSFRVVIKGLHSSTNQDELKEEISTKGHCVKNIYNVKSRKDQQPLPMFFLDIAPQENNKEIYEINHLLYCKVIIEPIRQIRQIPQCANCLRLGHTKNFCKRQTRCVKCGGLHSSKICKVSERKDLKCALCEQNHPANYRGCRVYKELQQKKFPALRPKTPPQQPHVKFAPETSNIREGRSFASAARSKDPNTGSKFETTSTNHKQPDDRISRLEKLVERMGERLDTMMSIVSKLLDKLN